MFWMRDVYTHVNIYGRDRRHVLIYLLYFVIR